MGIKKKTILLLGTLLIGLTACSKQDTADLDQIYTYIPEYRDFSVKEETILTAFLCDDEIILEATTDEGDLPNHLTFYSVPLVADDTEAREIPFEFPKSPWPILDIIKDQEGNYYTLENDRMSSRVVNGSVMQQGYKVGKYGPDGSLLADWVITEWLSQSTDEIYMNGLLMDKDENIYVWGHHTMLLLDHQGQYQGILANESISCAACGADGSVYFASSDLITQLKRVNFENVECKEVISGGFPLGQGMCLGENSELWVYDIDGLYRYDDKKQMPMQIVNWLDADVVSSNLTDIAVMPDGQIQMLLSGKFLNSQPPQLVSLTKREGEDTDRETITVSVMYLSETMRACAVQFNQEHPEYHVRLKEYRSINGYRNEEDAIKAMDLDIVSGKAPDIIAIPYTEMNKYMSKGLLEDLTPYLDASTTLSKENLIDAVAETYTFNGKLVALPTQLKLRVFVGRQSQLGDIQQWSVEDMIAFFEQNKSAATMNSISGSTMLDICLAFNLSYFVDAQNKTCHFDTEEFSRILEFSGQFTGSKNGATMPSVYQDDDRRLLVLQTCSMPCFAACAPQYFNNEPVSYVGYPTMDGQSGIMLSTAQDAYAILSTSEHKEAAWSFLEAAILAEGKTNNMRGYSTDISYTEFPIMRDQLEEQFAASMKGTQSTQSAQNNQPKRSYTVTLSFGDDVIYCYAPLKEEVDLMWELIDQARPAPQYDETVMNIIQEEAAGYFAGDKDISMVTATIQNRVQLYLNEK